MPRTARAVLRLPLLLALPLCACAPSEDAGANTIVAADENAMLQAAEENAAALAQDDDLANQAAADEAADTEVFGGNAAGGEGGNSAPDLATANGSGT